MDVSGERVADSGRGADGWYVYMLQSTDGKKTYVGATVAPDRRLRQHNGEIVGGARATKGRAWKRVALIGGFETEREALRFEWYWKYITRKGAPGDTFLERRWHALSNLLAEFEQAVVLEGPN